MTILIKLFYAGAVMALFILLVAFGIRTFYSLPEQPRYPEPIAVPRLPPPVATPGIAGEVPAAPTPTAEQLRFEAEQRGYQARYEAFTKERAEYRRNVFLLAAILAVAAIAGGLTLPGRLDAIRLGLVAGGLGTMLYAVIQAGGDLDEAGETVIFVAAGIGLLVVMAVGYRWLSRLET